jgi:hypothetical protein
VTKPIGPDTPGSTPSTPAHRRKLSRTRPLSTAELIDAGVRPEFLMSLALRRAAGGGVTKSGNHYLEWGYPTPSWLAGIFEQLTRTGLLALANHDTARLQRLSLTPAGRVRDQQLATLPPRVPNPAPATPTPATPTAPDSRSIPASADPATEIHQLAALLAEVVELAGKSALRLLHGLQPPHCHQRVAQLGAARREEAGSHRLRGRPWARGLAGLLDE